MDYISNLKKLIHFGFEKRYGIYDKIFCDSLKRISNKCQNLKSINTTYWINSHNSDIRQLLSPFEAFPSVMKRLNLTFNCYLMGFDMNEYFSFDAFEGLSNITHLTLHFNEMSVIAIEANIIIDIDIHLPKLLIFASN